MDRILIILKKENGPRASSAPALGLNTIIFKYVYWYMKQISGERLQDHWSSGFLVVLQFLHHRLIGLPHINEMILKGKNIAQKLGLTLHAVAKHKTCPVVRDSQHMTH